MDNDVHISVVIPVYNCDSCLFELFDRLRVTLEKISRKFEIIFVVDSSPDKSWQYIKKLAKKDSRIKGLKFSRNFGQHSSISAGLRNASGKWICVMDCDLQDRPEEIEGLYDKAKEGYDIVIAIRNQREDSGFKKFSSRIFYLFFNYLSGTKNNPGAANFGLYSDRAIGSVNGLNEQNRFFPHMINWVGFRKTYLNVKHAKRSSGKSSYSLKKLFRLGLDNIVAYSNKPLRISIKFGFYIAIIAFIYAIFLVSRYFFYGVSVTGWTSLMVSLWFISGLVLANIGIVGLYVGKVFDEVKNKPTYIVEDWIGDINDGVVENVEKEHFLKQ